MCIFVAFKRLRPLLCRLRLRLGRDPGSRLQPLLPALDARLQRDPRPGDGGSRRKVPMHGRGGQGRGRQEDGECAFSKRLCGLFMLKWLAPRLLVGWPGVIWPHLNKKNSKNWPLMVEICGEIAAWDKFPFVIKDSTMQDTSCTYGTVHRRIRGTHCATSSACSGGAGL